jgi:hypothetical protein
MPLFGGRSAVLRIEPCFTVSTKGRCRYRREEVMQDITERLWRRASGRGSIRDAGLMSEAYETIVFLRKLVAELEERVAEDDARWSSLVVCAAEEN